MRTAAAHTVANAVESPAMPERRPLLIASLLAACLPHPSRADAAVKPPPNLIRLDDRWLTAGQPSAQWLGTLKQQRIDAVLYLAPPTVGDALATEPDIVRDQGLIFVNVPVVWDRPSAADYRVFERQIRSWRTQRLSVLVHCQVNMRASVFSFLYLVINEGAVPEEAWSAVSRLWTPYGPWKRLVQELLAEQEIVFNPF